MAPRRRAGKAGSAAAESSEQQREERPAAAAPAASRLAPWRVGLARIAAVIALASTLSEWKVARSYDATLWKPALRMCGYFMATLVVAIVLAASPAGRGLKPGGAKQRGAEGKPKMNFIGIGQVMVRGGGGGGQRGRSPEGEQRRCPLCPLALDAR